MLINEKYKIESDNLNVTLYRLSKPRKEGVKNWDAIAFFSTPKNALKYLVENEITGTGMKDLKTVVDKMDELEGLINRLNMPSNS